MILTEFGVTTPAEITSLNASSTLISSSKASFLGILPFIANFSEIKHVVELSLKTLIIEFSINLLNSRNPLTKLS